MGKRCRMVGPNKKTAKFIVVFENIQKLRVGKTGYISPYDVILGYDAGKYFAFVRKDAHFSNRPAAPRDYGAPDALHKTFSVKISRTAENGWQLDLLHPEVRDKQAYDISRGTFKRGHLIRICEIRKAESVTSPPAGVRE